MNYFDQNNTQQQVIWGAVLFIVFFPTIFFQHQKVRVGQVMSTKQLLFLFTKHKLTLDF